MEKKEENPFTEADHLERKVNRQSVLWVPIACPEVEYDYKLHGKKVNKDRWGKKYYADCKCYVGHCYYASCELNKYNFKPFQFTIVKPKSNQLELY